MKEYFAYLLAISLQLALIFSAGYLFRCCNEKPAQRTKSVTKYILKVDTLKQEVIKWKHRIKPVNVHDTIQIVEQVAIRDTVIRIQDSIIVKQDTIIQTLLVNDSLQVQKIDSLNRSVNKERFWKRFWIIATGIGLIL